MLLSGLSDQLLVQEYLKGNDAAFETLVNRHQQIVFSRIMMLVKDEDVANDVFQDTFIKVIRTLKSGKYNEEGKFLPWLLRISHNLTIDYFRRNKKMPMVRSHDEYDVFATIGQEDRNAEDEMAYEQIIKDVQKLLEFLPEEQKEVVIMRLYQGMSFKEIADRNDISINTALGRMRYALINLRKIIAEKSMILTLS